MRRSSQSQRSEVSNALRRGIDADQTQAMPSWTLAGWDFCSPTLVPIWSLSRLGGHTPRFEAPRLLPPRAPRRSRQLVGAAAPAHRARQQVRSGGASLSGLLLASTADVASLASVLT